MTTVVRKASREDIPRLVGFALHLVQESEGIAIDENTLKLGVTYLFDHPELGQYWVLEVDNKPVGMAMTNPEWSDWYNAPYWWLQSIYIAPSHRGQGLLETIVSAIEREAQAASVRMLNLYVDKENERAIRAYQKLGFSDRQYLMMQRAMSTVQEVTLKENEVSTNQPIQK